MCSHKRLVLIYGGSSTEREVSQKSAAFIYRNYDRTEFTLHPVGVDQNSHWHFQEMREWSVDLSSLPLNSSAQRRVNPQIKTPRDALAELCALSVKDLDDSVFFPMIHGVSGEDGTLQGFLELAGVPFVGADTLGSAVGMDKIATKRMAASAGIPVVPFVEIDLASWIQSREKTCSRVLGVLGLPAFVKPARLGSSVGISKVKRPEELIVSIEAALRFDDKILIESGLDVRELECAMLGGYRPESSVIGEVVLNSEFYTYEEKYSAKTTATTNVPAEIPDSLRNEIQKLSRRAFEVLGLYGMARIDWFLERKTGQIYLNEVNTIPGFTELSHFPLFWSKTGKSGPQLISALVQLAVDRAQAKATLQRAKT